eukprot:gene9255-10964_t
MASVLTVDEYGYDPSVSGTGDVSWYEYATQAGASAILLIEKEGAMLYNRYDPHTVWAIPVLQLMFEDGRAIIEEIERAEEVTVELVTSPINSAHLDVLAKLVELCVYDGASACYYNGWFQLEPRTYALGLLNPDPCTDVSGGTWPGVDCDEDGNLSHLQMKALQLSPNRLPDEIGALSTLRTLYLFDCAFEALPAAVGALVNLRLLRIERAGMQGALPAALSAVTALRSLRLGHNGFSGDVPAAVLALPELRDLDLTNNQLTGAVVDCGAAEPEAALYLAGNSLSGQLPSLWPATLEVLDVSQNAFSSYGEVCGSGWSELQQLYFLNLASNELPWPLPEGAKQLPNLQSLYLGGNRMQLQFSDFYTLFARSVPGLKTVDLSRNLVWGELAHYAQELLPQFQSLTYLDLSDNLLGLNRSAAAAAVEDPGWSNAVEGSSCVTGETYETCSDEATATDASSSKSQECLRKHAMPGALPPNIRSVDFSGNYFGDEIPETWGDYALLEGVDATGQRPNGGRALQWCYGVSCDAAPQLPSFVTATTTRVKDASLSFSCPTLVIHEVAIDEGDVPLIGVAGSETDGSNLQDPKRTIQLDPAYYQHTYCSCETGYYVDPALTPEPPHCTPFPDHVYLSASESAITDGSSSGRVRQGIDTQWHLSAPAASRAITIRFAQLSQLNDSVIQVYEGSGISGYRVASFSEVVGVGDATSLSTSDFTVNVLQAEPGQPLEATVHFMSADVLGPHFSAQWQALSECPSQYQYDSTHGVCQPQCEKGQFGGLSGDGKRYTCIACQENTYSDAPGFQRSCTACPSSSTTFRLAGSISLLNCSCLPGSVGGTRVQVNAGFFKIRDSYSEYSCPIDGACLGSQGSELTFSEESTDSQCKEGTEGMLCAQCSDGFFQSLDDCIECGEAGESAASVVAALLFVAALVLALVLAPPGQFSVPLKIVASFLQVVYIYVQYVQLDWPRDFIDAVRWSGISHLALLDMTPLKCLMADTSEHDFFLDLALSCAALPALLGVMGAVYGAGLALITLQEGAAHGGESKVTSSLETDTKALQLGRKRHELSTRCANATLWLLCMGYPGVASKLFAFFRCKQVGSTSYLIEDYSIDCDGSEYQDRELLATVMLVLVVFVFPFVIFAMLLLNHTTARELSRQVRDEGMEIDFDVLRAVTDGQLGSRRRMGGTLMGRLRVWLMRHNMSHSFLSITGPYTEQCFYWEVAEMLRKMVILAITSFLADTATGTDMLCIGMFQTMCLVEHFLLQPFTSAAHQWAQAAALIGEVLLIQIAVAIAAGIFDGVSGAGTLLVVVTIMTLVAMLTASMTHLL